MKFSGLWQIRCLASKTPAEISFGLGVRMVTVFATNGQGDSEISPAYGPAIPGVGDQPGYTGEKSFVSIGFARSEGLEPPTF